MQRVHATSGGSGRFMDKMPLNYLYCGLIRRALPNAKIVHLIRHPMAVCYAMYKTLFKDGYPFSYDLEEIARYYIAYRRLMRHWRSTTASAVQVRRPIYSSSVAQWQRYAKQLEPLRCLLAAAGVDV